MEFACSVCQYTSKKKQHVVNHINKQKSCGPGIKEIIEIPTEINCEYCNKIFACLTSLKYHIKNSCKHKDNILKKRIAYLEQQLKTRSTPISIENNEEFTNYIYLIKIYPYEDNIYKLGRTGDILARLASYKRYKIVFITGCKDDVKCESDLLELYRLKTTQCKEMRNEYFYGTYNQMIEIVQIYFTPTNV